MKKGKYVRMIVVKRRAWPWGRHVAWNMSRVRPKAPSAPQANLFDVSKKNALGKLDKSPKGSLDAPIASLVNSINFHKDFVTTSSCSGRIVLFASGGSGAGGGRGGRWLLVHHGEVEVMDIEAALREEIAGSTSTEDKGNVEHLDPHQPVA